MRTRHLDTGHDRSALAGAARQGILIKGGLHLENAGRARVVAIDKTGTLTEGEPTVVDVVALDGADPRDVLATASGAEARSEHPLARAILRRAAEDGVHPISTAETRALPGLGVSCRSDGITLYVGNERLFRQLDARVEDARRILRSYEEQGRTAVLVGRIRVGARADTRPV